ncbi:hypothetical protein LIER_04271 [Lithospermum erythrorhizon]|uniref:Uncharacterized protein n=1 Tax=Lithospermum erythrorhizon TaxID=34254 RepID=A0AAV3NXD5_LITER
MPLFPSGSLPEDGVDSGPKVSVGYSANFLKLPYTLPGGLRVTEDSTLWKKQDAFQASRPLILKRVAKDFDEAHDPMVVQASIARYLIKDQTNFSLLSPYVHALNASHSLVRRSDALDNALADARKEERALRHQVQELVQKSEDLKGENEKVKALLAATQKEKKEPQEQCIQEAERLDLLHTRYRRVEAENVGLNSKFKNA